ncbi:hypothetical protein MDA_GLEAN10004763 [Myotis davidii]|uniref:Uncharacterized protein n=1 Tax=Myotis davidii TaxID=225400 RepID=L5M4Q4_MYODS|nr:hypothetical protein MDA_GLEAN10004763 [Myotis davidii]
MADQLGTFVPANVEKTEVKDNIKIEGPQRPGCCFLHASRMTQALLCTETAQEQPNSEGSQSGNPEGVGGLSIEEMELRFWLWTREVLVQPLCFTDNCWEKNKTPTPTFSNKVPSGRGLGRPRGEPSSVPTGSSHAASRWELHGAVVSVVSVRKIRGKTEMPQVEASGIARAPPGWAASTLWQQENLRGASSPVSLDAQGR